MKVTIEVVADERDNIVTLVREVATKLKKRREESGATVNYCMGDYRVIVQDDEPEPAADARPVCERCGEEDSDERLMGKVDTCQACVTSDQYRIEQLTDILQRFISGGRLESLLQACDNAGIRPKTAGEKR